MDIIIQMARIRQSLSPSKGLKLVNDMIEGTELQEDLVKWKEIHTSNSSGTVVKKYWGNFMRRHGDIIRSKRGQKYSLDRSNWSTYANFKDMYDHNIEEMEEAGVAKRRDIPVWMDRTGNVCDESEAVGCKVTHDLIHPEMCVVGDEVGGNLNMAGDGHVGGERYLCEKNSVPQQKTSTKDKHFTLLPLTLLTGQPLMCILIIAGKKHDALTEMGINSSAEMIGKEGDADFFENNSGHGKLYPGGPTCTVRGIEVPCFIRWSEKGSITSAILKEALAELDHLGVLPRVNGVKPFLLVDGHGSRFELEFLEYINHPDHEWVVCIGTPYGTALWQIGDAKECNGSLNIAMTRAKQDFLEEKTKMCMHAQLQTYDIIPLINVAWAKSFARVEKNAQAGADRGWNPLNRNLLTFPEIRATMTDEERELEAESSSTVSISQELVVYGTPVITSPSQPSMDHKFFKRDTPMPLLNYNTGNAAFCIDSLLQHDQLMTARQRIKKEQENGKSVREKIAASKRVTAGMLVKSGSHRLGQTVFDVVKERTQQKADALRTKIKKANDTHDADIRKRNAVLLAKPEQPDRSPHVKWTIKDLQSILKPMKRTEDGAMPSKKPPLLELYRVFCLENRVCVSFPVGDECDVMVEVQEEEAADEDEDVYGLELQEM